jgi:hypothetical protein
MLYDASSPPLAVSRKRFGPLAMFAIQHRIGVPGNHDRSGARSDRFESGRRGSYGVGMSSYALNKLLRDVNRDPGIRERFFKDAAAVAAGYDLSDEERRAVLARDVTALYRLGVHGLILRPFTILHQMPEPDYLEAIRK